jgi:DNA-binding beta-propeller fold protein YncE
MLTLHRLTVAISLACSLSLLAACQLPTALTGGSEVELTRGTATVKLSGQTLKLVTADGKPLQGLTVLVGGKSYSVRDGKLFLPDAALKEAKARGEITVLAPGYAPTHIALGGKSDHTLIPSQQLAVSRDVPPSGGLMEAGDHSLKVQLPAFFLTNDKTNVAIGAYQPALDGNGSLDFTVDPDTGDLYVAEAGGRAIRKVTPAGVTSLVAGHGKTAGVDGAFDKAGFTQPVGIVHDGKGHLYVVDGNANTIRKIDLTVPRTSAKYVTTVAGTGVAGNKVGDTPLTTQFDGPSGVGVLPDGRVVVVDSTNHRLITFKP